MNWLVSDNVYWSLNLTFVYNYRTTSVGSMMETRLLCLIEQINWFLSSISIHPIVIQIIRLVSIYLESILYMFWWNSMCPPPSGCRGRDLMVVGLTATFAISAYHHQYCEFKPRSWWSVLETTICDKVCQWLTTGQWFSPALQFPPPIKLTVTI
jgi:hypothetical protein